MKVTDDDGLRELITSYDRLGLLACAAKRWRVS